MSLKDKRDFVIVKKEELLSIKNKETKYEVIKEIEKVLKEIYNITVLNKDKIELIEMYLEKSSFEENYVELDNNIQKAYNTLRKAKRLIDELFLHNRDIQERKLLIRCYYDHIRLGSKLKIKKNNKNLFKLYNNTLIVYNLTKYVDDLKDIIKTNLLIADIEFEIKHYLISRLFYIKGYKKLKAVYEEYKHSGMKKDLNEIIVKILNTYKRKNKGFLNWKNTLKSYGGKYE